MQEKALERQNSEIFDFYYPLQTNTVLKPRIEAQKTSILKKYPKLKHEPEINLIWKRMLKSIQRTPRQLAALSQHVQNKVYKSKLLRFVCSRNAIFKTLK